MSLDKLSKSVPVRVVTTLVLFVVLVVLFFPSIIYQCWLEVKRHAEGE